MRNKKALKKHWGNLLLDSKAVCGPKIDKINPNPRPKKSSFAMGQVVAGEIYDIFSAGKFIPGWRAAQFLVFHRRIIFPALKSIHIISIEINILLKRYGRLIKRTWNKVHSHVRIIIGWLI